MRVLQTDQTGLREVQLGDADGGLDVPGRHDPVGPGHPVDEQPAHRRDARHLGPEDVGVTLQNRLLTVSGVGQDGDEIPHRAADHEEGCLLAEELRRVLLQLADRGIPLAPIVPHLRSRHRLPHLLGRLRDRVTAKVQLAVKHSCLLRRPLLFAKPLPGEEREPLAFAPLPLPGGATQYAS